MSREKTIDHLKLNDLRALLRTKGLYLKGNKDVLRTRAHLFDEVCAKNIMRPPDSFRAEIGVTGLRTILKLRQLPITGTKAELWNLLISHEQTALGTITNDPEPVDSFSKRFTENVLELEQTLKPKKAAILAVLEYYTPPNITLVTSLYDTQPIKQRKYLKYLHEYETDYRKLFGSSILYSSLSSLSPRELARRVVAIASTLQKPLQQDILDQIGHRAFSNEEKKRNTFAQFCLKFQLGI